LLTAKKLRKLELIADAKRHDRSAAGIWTAHRAMPEAEKQLARQAEASYVRTVHDCPAAAPTKVGASATPEHPARDRLSMSAWGSFVCRDGAVVLLGG
jgi:hypothetical protein